MENLQPAKDSGRIDLSRATLDLRSPAGSLQDNRRLLLNMVGGKDAGQKLIRIGGWRKLCGAAYDGVSARVAVIGNFGSADANEESVRDLVNDLEPEAIVTTGNNVDYDGTYTSAKIDECVGYYREWIDPYTGDAELPDGRTQRDANAFYPCIGAKDVEGSMQSSFVAYFESIWGDKGLASDEGDLHYTFTIGPIQFFVVGTEMPGDPESDYYFSGIMDFIAQNIHGSTARYHVLVAHLAPYTNDAAEAPGTNWMRTNWARLGIDLVLCGQCSNYERLSVNGIPHVIIGAGGLALGGFVSPLQVGTSVVRKSAYGALLIEADMCSMRLRFIGINNAVLDSFEIGYKNQDLHDQLLPSGEEYPYEGHPYEEYPYEMEPYDTPCSLEITNTAPLFQEVYEDASFSLSIAVAGGAATKSYQWYRVETTGNELIANGLGEFGYVSGAQSANMTIAGVTEEASGAYLCIVSDSSGCNDTSDICQVQVTTAPTYYTPPTPLEVTLQPVGGAYVIGDPVSMTTAVTGGTPPYSYRWHRLINGTPVALSDDGRVTGTDTDTLAISVFMSVDVGDYYCVISDSGSGADFQTVATDIATLSISDPTEPPACYGSSIQSSDELDPCNPVTPDMADAFDCAIYETYCLKTPPFTGSYQSAASDCKSSAITILDGSWAAAGLTAAEYDAIWHMIDSFSYVEPSGTRVDATYGGYTAQLMWYTVIVYGYYRTRLKVEYSRA